MKSRRRKSHNTRNAAAEGWNERTEGSSAGSRDSGFSASVIEFRKKLAQDLQKMRLEYIEQHHREPELTDFERILIEMYC
jgi:hypothetical protein